MPLPEAWRKFCENAPHAMLIADTDGVIVWANTAASLILGRESPGDLRGEKIITFLFSVRISGWDDLSARARTTGSFACSALLSGQMKPGSTLDLRITHATDGGKEWYYLYFTRVGGNEGFTRSTRRDEERLNLALQCADLGAWDINLRSGEMVVDGRWAKMLGYRLGDLMPLTEDGFMVYVHPDDRDACIRMFSGWRKGKNPSGSHEMRLRHRNGTWVWVRTQWQVYWSPETEPVLRVVGVHQDITDTVKKDDAIREAQAKVAMLSSVTRHDILNQVTVIRMLCDIMEMTGEVPTDSDTWKQLSKINEAAVTIERQIGFTRDYEDLGSELPAWQDIGDMVSRMAATSEFSHLTVTCTCTDLMVYADLMLERVLSELFTNSVTHGGDVTTITVSCRTEADNTAVIDVADDGAGISDARKESIFSRGIGIQTRYGLYLAREILSVTGITIRETGMEGTGAVFSLSVPQQNWKMRQNHRIRP